MSLRERFEEIERRLTPYESVAEAVADQLLTAVCEQVKAKRKKILDMARLWSEEQLNNEQFIDEIITQICGKEPS